MNTRSHENPLYKRLALAGAILAGSLSMEACSTTADERPTPEVAAQLEATLKPTAVEVARLALEQEDSVISISDDGDSYLTSVGLFEQDPHYSVLVRIAKEGDAPADPEDVTRVSFDEWENDPTQPGTLRIASSLKLSSTEDAPYNSHNWYGMKSFYVGNNSNRINDLVVLTTAHPAHYNEDPQSAIKVADLIADNATDIFIPRTFNQ